MGEILGFLDRFGPALVVAYGVAYFVFNALGNYTLQALSDKTEAIPSWIAWVPFVQTHAFVRAAGTSWPALLAWVAAGILVGGVSMFAAAQGAAFSGVLVVVYALAALAWFGALLWRLAERRQLSGWLGLACLIPFFGLFVFAYIAFHDGLVRPSRAGLALTAALALLGALSTGSELREFRAGLVAGSDLSEAASGVEASPEPAAGGAPGRGLLDRLVAWSRAARAPSIPRADDFPSRVECEDGTRAAGAGPPPAGDEMWCERTDTGLRHGWYLAWHQNGQLREAGVYENGERQGSWTRFWNTGAPQARTRFEGGRQDGVLRRWDARGQPLEESVWKDGQPAG